jgi:hypothetical protein
MAATTDSLSISEFASLFGFPASVVAEAIEAQRQRRSDAQAFYTLSQLTERWNCSKAQVYSVLYDAGVKAVNIGQGKKRGKFLVPTETVLKIEKARMEKMS